MRNIYKQALSVIGQAVVGMSIASGAMAQANVSLPLITLPNPVNAIDTLTPQTYHDAVVYSKDLLIQQQGYGYIPSSYGPYDFATGSIDLGVMLFGSLSNPTPFESAIDSATSNSGTWGAVNNGTVAALRALLTGTGGKQYQPYFFLDFAEPQNATTSFLQMSGQLRILDSSGNPVGASYVFDTNSSGAWVPGARVPVCGHVFIDSPNDNQTPGADIDCALTSSGAHDYEWHAEKGSGKPDYFLTIPDFDIWSTAYNDPSLRFVVDVDLASTSGSDEEIGIGGYLFDAPNNNVPEPGSLALMVTGFLVLGRKLRSRQSAGQALAA